jgi:IS1 family transposase
MNKLSKDKQSLILSQLVEGQSVRSVERITGVHRDTILRLLVRAAEKANVIHDLMLRDLPAEHIMVDEIWSYCGAKQKNVQKGEILRGDQYVFVAMDSKTKLVPAYAIGKRDNFTTHMFIRDLATRIVGGFQISSDSFTPYTRVIPAILGHRVTYGQVHKEYNEEYREQKRYSPARLVKVTIRKIIGNPDPATVSTSHIERQNLTMRMSMRRFTRLTNGFSKKLKNLRAAVSVHFYYYNFMRVHSTHGLTPAMAAGVTDAKWSWDMLLGA